MTGKADVKVMIHNINPKSIFLNQLFGEIDKVSHDWTDGVLSHVVK